MWGYLAQPSMYAMYALRHHYHSCLSSSSFNELIKKGRYCLVQRTRYLIDQVSSIWKLLQHDAADPFFKLQEMFLQIDGSPIHLRLLKDYVADHCMPQPEKQFVWTDACHQNMRMPALAASPDHPHHTMANCASLASAFTHGFSRFWALTLRSTHRF